jgi:hypothetical protein
MAHEIENGAIMDIMLQQAGAFLEDAGEFYPFGAAITAENEIVTIGVKMDNEHPSSSEVLEQLDLGVNIALHNGKYLLATIGVNVTLTRNELKQDALEIRIMQIGKDIVRRYYSYDKFDGVYKFTLINSNMD